VNPPPFATHWARELGAKEESLIQLKGGINNRVYRCGIGNAKWVIKGYSAIEEGQRDRMQAEVEFLTYAAEVSPKYVPHLIYVDYEHRCVVLGHIEGKTFLEGEVPSPEDIEAAVDFFRLLNSAGKVEKQHIQLDAAEGFLQLTDHIENVRDRLSKMSTDHLPPEAKKPAVELLQWVQDAADRVSNLVAEAITKGTVANCINPEQRCISPSDFGFHNAIRTKFGVQFFDFEFAGWDDPAKAASDFVLQPRVPARLQISPLLAALNDDTRGDIHLRCAALGPVLRLKWACIMLSVLESERLDKLLTAHPDTDLNVLMHQRLNSTAAYVREEIPFGLH
jgi:hypothetical protein